MRDRDRGVQVSRGPEAAKARCGTRRGTGAQKYREAA